MADIVGVDVSGLTGLARVLDRVEPSLERDLRRGMDAAAEIAAANARREAGFSSRIPDTIKVTRRGPLNRRIRAGGPDAPHAAGYEDKAGRGEVRHPVFGRWLADVPYAKSHPFLAMDDQTVDVAVAAIDAAVDSALRGISVV